MMIRIEHGPRWVVGLALAILVLGGGTGRAEVIVETYASMPLVPYGLTFGADGELYVGTALQSQPGGDVRPSWVLRVAPGGSTVTTYGERMIADPDAVFYDATGALSGEAGSVIVGGFAPWNGVQNRGRLSAIRPDGTIDEFTSTNFINPVQFASDSQGRLLFTDQRAETAGVFASELGTWPPTRLIPAPPELTPFGLAVDGEDRIYASSLDGVVRVFEPDGTLIDFSFATLFDPTGLPIEGLRTQLAFAPGGMFGTDLYATTGIVGEILRIGPDGETTSIASGLGAISSIAFGPDGAMYVGDVFNQRILRLSVIPEPSSLLLAGLGGVAVVGWRVRRRVRP